MSDRICPDGGVCHHWCQGLDCFRTRCCEPLSGIYPNDRWPEGIAGVPVVFVGGPLDGQVRKVAHFGEAATPDEYEPITVYTRMEPDGMFHEDGGHMPVYQRLDVVFWRGLFEGGVPGGMTYAAARGEYMLAAMAKSIGILYTRPEEG